MKINTMTATVGSIALLTIIVLLGGVTYNYFRGTYIDQERSEIVEEAKNKFIEECIRANVVDASCRQNEVKIGGAESEGYPEWIISIETVDGSYKADMLGKIENNKAIIYQYQRYE